SLVIYRYGARVTDHGNRLVDEYFVERVVLAEESNVPVHPHGSLVVVLDVVGKDGKRFQRRFLFVSEAVDGSLLGRAVATLVCKRYLLGEVALNRGHVVTVTWVCFEEPPNVGNGALDFPLLLWVARWQALDGRSVVARKPLVHRVNERLVPVGDESKDLRIVR